MTDLLNDIDTSSDAELISSVRGGDVAAYGQLFERHVQAANRLGRQLARGPDVDDLVSEAFAKVLQVLQRGGGPDVAFRAYLLTAVRRLHVDKIRSGAKLQTTDDMTQFDPGIPFQDTAVADFENGAAAKAFASLPERWQLVLWHLEVEGQKPLDIAPLLGMSANSVSALAYRAREGLRQAFLTMHLADISAEDCRWVNEHLGAYVRKGLARRDTAKVQEHLDECRRCTAMYLELSEVNSNLAGIIAPLLLGSAAAGYLSSSGAGATGLLAVAGRVRDSISANAGLVTAGALAAGVAVAATAGFLMFPPGDTDVVISAEQLISTTDTESTSTAPYAASLPGLSRFDSLRSSTSDDVSDSSDSNRDAKAPVDDPKAGRDNKGDRKPNSDSDKDPTDSTGANAGTGPNVGTGSGTGGNPGAGTGVAPGTGTGTDPTGTDPGTDPGTGPGPDPAPTPDPGPDPAPPPPPPPPSDPGPFEFIGTPSSSAAAGQNGYTVQASLGGLPTGGGTLVFTLTKNAEDRFKSEDMPGCEIANDERSMTCAVSGGNYSVTFTAKLAGGSLGTLTASIGGTTISSAISG